MNKVIYMDNNATTRVAPEVLETMLPYFSELYGNPSSMYRFGGAVGQAIKTARGQIANLLGAEPEEIIFTSCGTESDSTAILSAVRANPEKRHIVTTRVEHPAVKNLAASLQNLTGHKYEVTSLGVDREGMLDLDEYREALSDSTALVSIMWANNETGLFSPLPRWRKLPTNEAYCSIPMRCRRLARCLLT